MFNRIYMKQESVDNECKCVLNLGIVFNWKDGIGEDWNHKI